MTEPAADRAPDGDPDEYEVGVLVRSLEELGSHVTEAALFGEWVPEAVDDEA